MAFLLRSFATPPPPTSRSSLWRYEYPNEYCGLESLVVSRWGMRSIDHSTARWRSITILTSIQVFGFPEVIGWDDAPTEPHAVHLSLEWSSITPWDTTQIAGSLPKLLRHLYHPHVRSLCFIFDMDGHNIIPVRTWAEILSMYRAVQHLNIYGTVSTSLLDALLQHATHFLEPCSSSLQLPVPFCHVCAQLL
ncbi:hypothetical protein EDD16DRAFT_999637 [Pisolithus croceorrhizus]|nr:hypothetical protein EDD16DRAFT_999637 [Pisolithus croceorrhizus]